MRSSLSLLLLLLAGCGDCSDSSGERADVGDDPRAEQDMRGTARDAEQFDAGTGDGGRSVDATARDLDEGCSLRLAHAPAATFEIGGALDIVAQLDPNPDTVTLHYRRGFESDFTAIDMTDAGGGSWHIAIPPVIITFAGLDYWLEAKLADCVVTSPVTNPRGEPHHVDVFGEYQITRTTDGYEYTPDVWGRSVVFAQEKQGGRADDIVLFDLDRLLLTKVTEDARGQGNPRIWGKNVVYVDNYGDNPEVGLYDVETGESHRVTNDPEGQYGLEIDGHVIVWRDDRNRGNTTHGDIYGYDLGRDMTFGTADDGGELELVKELKDQTAPRVHVGEDGRVRVVYTSMTDDADGVCDADCDSNVYFLDFGPDGTWGTADDIGPTRLTSDPNEQHSPVVWGTRVAWLDARGGNWLDPDIWTMDLGPDGVPGTADDVAPSELPVAVQDPDDLAIWETRLVWEDYRTMGYELYAWDFGSETEEQLTAVAGGQFYPEVWDNVVVWQDARNNPVGEVFDDVYVRVFP